MEIATKHRIQIERIAYGGAGIGHIDGKIVFVPGALPGEEVAIEIVRDKPRHAFGRMVEQPSNASPFRTEPRCPFALRPPDCASALSRTVCPGCVYQHLSYEVEIAEKQRQHREKLGRLPFTDDGEFLPPIAAAEAYHYRNKLSLHAQICGSSHRLGYFLEDNRTVFDLPTCPLAMNPILERLCALRENRAFRKALRDGDRLTLRQTAGGDVWDWVGTAKSNDTWLREETPFGTFSVPRNGFFQVNPEIAAHLAETVAITARAVRPERILDLFCGVGVFGIVAARQTGCPALGIEENPECIAAAVCNARRAELENAVFQVRNLVKNADIPAEFTGSGTFAIVDPPRNGLPPAVVAALIRQRPETLLYISCAADTLARDLASLTKTAGYRIRSTQVFDMFPRTPHFESTTLLV
jgi:23S rRNA (uracil1939-C5)-methyltransferase